MANEDFKVGNKVRLKPGGESMTIESIDGDFVRCTWFDKNQVRHTEDFKKEMLENVPIECCPIYVG